MKIVVFSYNMRGWMLWLMPVIPTTWEAKIEESRFSRPAWT
jgi:hypothetical protein